MMFALGVSVGCAVAVLLIFAVANLTRQKATPYMVQAHADTVALLGTANELRERQAEALESIGAWLASQATDAQTCPNCKSNAKITYCCEKCGLKF